VYSRLFDHKPVIRGEINFFVNQFEVFHILLQFYCNFIVKILVCDVDFKSHFINLFFCWTILKVFQALC